MRFLVIVAALFLCPPAFSQTMPGASDQQALRACVREHSANRASACIGLVSRACHDAMGEDAASTSFGAVSCAGREHEAWGAILSQAEAELRAGEAETQRALLDSTLSAGETWGAARCAYAASIYEGGSLARVVYASCARDVMAMRALELLDRLDLIHGH